MKKYSLFLSLIFFLTLCFGLGSHFQAEAKLTVPQKIETASWIDSQENDGITYFLFDSSPRIERYELESETFLDPIILSDTPTAFTVDPEGIFVSFSRRTSRLTLDGSKEAHLHNSSSNVKNLFTFNEFLYLQNNQTITGINKFSGKRVFYKDYFYGMSGISVSKEGKKIFARSTGVSPSNILQISINADGTLGDQRGSPYHGSYPNARKTYLFSNEARVVDSAGIVYSAADLSYNNSFAGEIDDIAFNGDIPIVLRGNTLIAYSNTLLKTGEYSLEYEPCNIYVMGDSVFTFHFDGNESPCVEKIALSWINANEPGEPVDPTDLVYTPDSVQLGNDEIVYLLSHANLSIFRWSIPEERYLETIPLVKVPSHMAYSPVNNTIYLAYPNGELTQIALNSSTTEIPFANSPQKPLGIAAAGNYLFVCDPTGPWVSHFTYKFDGTLVAAKDWNYFSSEYIWNEVNQRMYFLRDDTSPNNLHSEEIRNDGSIGAQVETPYHGIHGIRHPIRVAPDGSVVILGSGLIFDAHDLTHIGSLSNDIEDAVWKEKALFTICSTGKCKSQIQKWNSENNYEITATWQLAGKAFRIFSTSMGVFAAYEVEGKPTFTILNF